MSKRRKPDPYRGIDLEKVERHSKLQGTLEPLDPTFVRNAYDRHDNRCWCNDCTSYRLVEQAHTINVIRKKVYGSGKSSKRLRGEEDSHAG